MALFGLFGRRGCVGVDIGTNSLKIVELEKRSGKVLLRTFGSIDISSDIIHSSSRETRVKIATALKKIIDKAGVRSRDAVVSLPGFAIFSTVLEIPHIPKKELESAILWEAKKFVPDSADEMLIDWKLIGERGKPRSFRVAGNKNAKQAQKEIVLINAVPRNLVTTYRSIVQQAGLHMQALETEAFSLARSLTARDDEPTIVLDVGASATDIMVIQESIPLLTRSLDVGGNAITDAIAKSLNIEWSRAEQFKRDFGFDPQKLSGQIPQAMRYIIDDIVLEIKKTQKLFFSKYEKKVSRVLLSGGTSNIPFFENYLSHILETRVSVGDPWKHVGYPPKLAEHLRLSGPTYAIAVGLALREI
jgi:type IV pilus assembly protein PilM